LKGRQRDCIAFFPLNLGAPTSKLSQKLSLSLPPRKLFFFQQADPESLERENDRSIDALGERVGALRAMTSGIHGEVESQHRLLDSMVRLMFCFFLVLTLLTFRPLALFLSFSLSPPFPPCNPFHIPKQVRIHGRRPDGPRGGDHALQEGLRVAGTAAVGRQGLGFCVPVLLPALLPREAPLRIVVISSSVPRPWFRSPSSV
jgi:hypothetical protein